MANQVSQTPRAAVVAALLTLLVTVARGNGDETDRCKSSPGAYLSFYASKSCETFYKCHNGDATSFQCPARTHFSNVHQVCVWKYQQYDDCARDNARRECNNGFKGRIGHPTDCKRYFDCSDSTPRPKGSPYRQYENECPGATVFDVARGQCVAHGEAYCADGRKRPACLGNSCYELILRRADWDGGQKMCEQRGGNLASVETETEYNFLVNFINTVRTPITNRRPAQVWVGATDRATEGTWVWQPTGQVVSGFSNWHGNHPNGGTSENCMVWLRGQNYRWFDKTCSETARTLCEKTTSGPTIYGGSGPTIIRG